MASTTIPKVNITSQDEYIIKPIKDFYKKGENLKILEDILVQNDTNISLRILDYFPNNYARDRNIIINNVHIYSDYKNILKGYTQKNFDPFCRGQCIKLYKDNLEHKFCDTNDKNQKVTDEYIVTTIRQLNFFKWCIDRKVIDYISDHLDEIQKSISESSKTDRKKKKCVYKDLSKRSITFD